MPNSIPGSHALQRCRLRLAVLALPLVAALAPAASAAEGELIVAQPNISQHFDPTVMVSTTDVQIYNMLYDGLLNLGAEGRVPGLATKWTISEDAKQIDFELRQGVKFQNGEDFTADDVKFSFEILLEPENKHTYAKTIREALERVEVIGPHHARFVLKKPWGSFFTSNRSGGLQPIIPKSYYEEVGPKGFLAKPVGTGPFKLIEAKPSESNTFAINADYWGGVGNVKTVLLKAVPEPFTRFAMLQRGEADIITGLSGPLLKRTEGSKDIRIALAKYSGTSSLLFNKKLFPAAADRRVRLAIAHAINREEIARTILGGACEPATHVFTPAQFGHLPGLDLIPYDPAKSKALLKEAGIAPGTEVTFSIHTQSFASLPSTPQVLEAIAGAVEGLGFKVIREPVETGAWFKMMRGGKQPGIFYGPSSMPDDGGDSLNSYYTSWSNWVPGIMNVPEYDQLFDEQLNATTLEKRKEALQKFARLEHERREQIPLFWCHTPFAVGKKVKEWTPAISSGFPMNLHQIRLAQ